MEEPPRRRTLTPLSGELRAVPDRERMISNSFVYAAIGIVLVLIGIVVDQAL